MAPRRNNSIIEGGSTTVSVLGDFQNLTLEPLLMDNQMETVSATTAVGTSTTTAAMMATTSATKAALNINMNNNNNMTMKTHMSNSMHTNTNVNASANCNGNTNVNAGVNVNVTTCCVPTSECLRNKELIYLNNNVNDVVKVICTYDFCPVSKYMHKECFEHWENIILSYLKSCGRARSWSEKQRQQNLWTKNGYDLIFKSCNCLCGRGFLRKDLEWSALNSNTGTHSEMEKKKKKKRRQNNRPTITVSAAYSNGGTINTNAYNFQQPQQQQQQQQNNVGQTMDNVLTPIELRARTVSISSSSNRSNGSSSPLASSSNSSLSPTIPLPGIIGSGQKKKKKLRKPDP